MEVLAGDTNMVAEVVKDKGSADVHEISPWNVFFLIERKWLPIQV
jgi:hypothetical protein